MQFLSSQGEAIQSHMSRSVQSLLEIHITHIHIYIYIYIRIFIYIYIQKCLTPMRELVSWVPANPSLWKKALGMVMH